MSGKATEATSGCAPSESSPSGQAISNSVDLLTKILLLLPVKSLIRFECVSKHWLSLISDSEFAANHSRRNPTTSISGLYFSRRNPSNRLSSVSLHGHRNLPSLFFLDGLEGKYFPTTIQHSCNGLQLFDTRYVDPNGHRLPVPLYIVCNPTTNKYTMLPKTGFPSRLPSRRGAYLSFDPSKSHHYKVIVASRHHAQSFEIDVYYSQTRNWKRIYSYFPQNTSYGRGVFWNGAIHWLSFDNSLLKFDVDAEKLITILPHPHGPIIINIATIVRYFGECGGGLVLIQSRSFSSTEFRILEMESETSRWIVKSRVNLRAVVAALPEIENVFKCFVLCVVESKMKEDSALVLAIPGKVVSYNLKSKRLDVLRDLVPGELIDHGVNGFSYPFVETLAPV